MGSEKFIIPTFISCIGKEEAIGIINKHIKDLKEKLEYWQYWKDVKITDEALELEKISFEMTIDNLANSIKWHKALIKEFDAYVELSEGQKELISSFNFEEIEIPEEEEIVLDKEKIEILRGIMESNPKEVVKELEKLLNRDKK